MGVLVIQVTLLRCPSSLGSGVCKGNGITERNEMAVLWDKRGADLVSLLCERPYLPPGGSITLDPVCLQVPSLRFCIMDHEYGSDLLLHL